ncbi:MAG: tail fiber domain-containing protein [Moorea sp. SIO3G5]|nr:tail fiber domain-containing protein [Moorena sp. SIO3G5]
MMYIHQSARNNASRPIIAHSPSHRNWGVEYREHGDLIVFQGSGEPVLSVGLGSKKVGIGTNNPRQKLEVAGTVKATRFEGDGSGLTGISAGGTKWSDGGSNRIYYNAGNVGIGTNNPTQKLEVAGSVKAIATNTGNRTAYGVQSVVGGNRNGTKFGLYAQATGGTSGSRFGVYGRADAHNNTSAIVYGVYGRARGGKTSYAGYFDGNANVTGHLTYRTIGQVSSRELKENINTLAIEDAIETLEGLNPVQFSYKKDHQKETHIGFIAEDVPDLVASHDRKTLSPMDIVAVLTKVVKEQNNTISLLMEKVKTLEQKTQSSAF